MYVNTKDLIRQISQNIGSFYNTNLEDDTMPAANRESIETVDIGRGNHYEPRNSQFKPVRRSSTLRSDEWDFYDRSNRARYDRYDEYRPRYEEVEVHERPGRSVSYQDNDYYDRWQENSGPVRHYVTPSHTHRGAQSQMVGVRPRPRSPTPVDYDDDERVIDSVGSRKFASKTAAAVGDKGAPKAQNESQHVPGLFQTVFDVNHPQDASVHLELPITDDHGAELEEFCRLQRLGNFGAAEDYFKNKLEPYLSHPYVFVQFGQMLLEKGDYLAFERLNPEAIFGKDDRAPSRFREEVVVVDRSRSRPRARSQSRSRSLSRSRERQRETRVRSRSQSPVEGGRHERRARFEPDVRIVTRRSRSRSADNIQRYYVRERYVERDRSFSPDGEPQLKDTKPNPDYDELELLRQNWRLLKATSIIHGKGSYEDAFTGAWSTIETLRFGTGIGSTEASICSLFTTLSLLTNATDTDYEAGPAIVCIHCTYSS